MAINFIIAKSIADNYLELALASIFLIIEFENFDNR